MIGYTTLGTNDLEKAKAFYDAALAPLGAKRGFAMDRAQFYTAGAGPMFGVFIPYDKLEAKAGNGTMVALAAESRAAVDATHAAALANGGQCEGPPGERMPNFYGAYFRDLDGNKICVFKMG